MENRNILRASKLIEVLQDLTKKEDIIEVYVEQGGEVIKSVQLVDEVDGVNKGKYILIKTGDII